MKAGKSKALKSSKMKRNRIKEYNGNFFWAFLHSINQKIFLNRISIKMPFLSGWYFRRFTIISGCRGCAEKVIYLPTDRSHRWNPATIIQRKKSTRNIKIKRSKLMNYGLWIVDRSIGKTSEKTINFLLNCR